MRQLLLGLIILLESLYFLRVWPQILTSVPFLYLQAIICPSMNLDFAGQEVGPTFALPISHLLLQGEDWSTWFQPDCPDSKI